MAKPDDQSSRPLGWLVKCAINDRHSTSNIKASCRSLLPLLKGSLGFPLLLGQPIRSSDRTTPPRAHSSAHVSYLQRRYNHFTVLGTRPESLSHSLRIESTASRSRKRKVSVLPHIGESQYTGLLIPLSINLSYFLIFSATRFRRRVGGPYVMLGGPPGRRPRIEIPAWSARGSRSASEGRWRRQ